MTETFEEFFERTKHLAVLSVDAASEPEDDVIPQLLLQDSQGYDVTIALLGSVHGSAGARRFVGGVAVPGLIRGMRAVRLGVVIGAWVSLADEGSERGQALESGALEPRDDREGQEAMLVVAAEAARSEMCYARLLRSLDGPPKLGEWVPCEPHIREKWFAPAIEALEPMGAAEGGAT